MLLVQNVLAFVEITNIKLRMGEVPLRALGIRSRVSGACQLICLSA